MRLIVISAVILNIFCLNLTKKQSLISTFINSFQYPQNQLQQKIVVNHLQENFQSQFSQTKQLESYSTLNNNFSQNKRVLVGQIQQNSYSQSLEKTFLALEYLAFLALFFSMFSSKLIGLQLFGVIQYSFLIMCNFPEKYSLIKVFTNRKQLNGYNLQNLLQNYDSNLPTNLKNNGYTSPLLNVNLNFMLLLMMSVLMIYLLLLLIISILQSFSSKKNKNNCQQNSQQIQGQITNVSLVTNQKEKEDMFNRKSYQTKDSAIFNNSENKITKNEEQIMSIDNQLQQKQSTQSKHSNLNGQMILRGILICQKASNILLRQVFLSIFIFTLPNGIFSCGLQLYYQIDVILQVQQISIASTSGLSLLIYFILIGIAFYLLCTHQNTKFNYGQLKIKLRSTMWGKIYLLILVLQIMLTNAFLAFLNNSNICCFLILILNISFLMYIIALEPYKKNIQNYRSLIVSFPYLIITIINILYRNLQISETIDLTLTIIEFITLFLAVLITLAFQIRQLFYGCTADIQPCFQERIPLTQKTTIQTEENEKRKGALFKMDLIKVNNSVSSNLSKITNNQIYSHSQIKRDEKKAKINNLSQKKVKNIDDEDIEQNNLDQNVKKSQKINKEKLKRLKIYIPKSKKKVEFKQNNQTHFLEKQTNIKSNEYDKNEQMKENTQQNIIKKQLKEIKNQEIIQNNKNDLKIVNNQRMKKMLTIKINRNTDHKTNEEISFKQL